MDFIMNIIELSVWTIYVMAGLCLAIFAIWYFNMTETVVEELEGDVCVWGEEA